MIAPKLTIAQARVLSELRKPGMKAYYMGGSNPYWFLSPGGARCTRQIEALKKLGLLQIDSAKDPCPGPVGRHGMVNGYYQVATAAEREAV